MTMNAADILILAVLALSTLFGLLRGFVSEVLSLVCWVAAFWVSWAFGARVADFYIGMLHEPAARIIAGYVTCFVGVLIVGALVGFVARRLLIVGGLRGGDRLLGMLFGLVRGWLLVTFVVLMLGFTPLPRESAGWRQSWLLPTFEIGAGWLADALPADVTRYLQAGGRALPALPRAPISGLRQLVPSGPASSSGGRPAAARSTSSRAHALDRARGDVGQ
ncbi:MAG: CvpA family protein [Rhodanobacteraceae bacterium]